MTVVLSSTTPSVTPQSLLLACLHSLPAEAPARYSHKK